MLSLVSIICFLFLFWVFQKSRNASYWRESFLSASLVWGLLLTVITECLSVFKLINFWGILGLWIVSFVIISIYLIRENRGVKALGIRSYLSSISRFDIFLLAGIFVIVVIVGGIGLVSPPNTWDSMTYHMSRVVHWIQNGSVTNYPTHLLRQLYQGPWAEFAILHFQILTRGDRLANSIQWFSLLGAAIGASLLAKQFGAGLHGQVFAAVFSVTIPMGIIQGSSTQTDYVVSFWLVSFAYFAILQKGKDKIWYTLATGVSLGLAFLSKPIAYIYAFPFMAWVSLSLVKTRRERGLLQIVLIVAVAFVINLGQYARNYDLFRNPIGPSHEGEYKYSNDAFTLPAIASNVVRNLGLHIGTPFNQVNSFLEKEIYSVHKTVGLDTNDSRTTWLGTKFHVLPTSLHEDTAGNPLHLLLMIVSIPLIIGQRKQKNFLYYFICLVSAFVLFCLYTRWQPWNSRLHLPFFVLWSPLIGLPLPKIRSRWMADFGITILLLGAIPYLLYNEARPILGNESILTTDRIRLYFSNRPSLARPYTQSAEFVLNTGCSDIGLILPIDGYEYPLWVLLNQDNKQLVHIEHVNVTNISQAIAHEYPYNAFIPCAVMVAGENLPDEISVGEVLYLQEWKSKTIAVFMQK